MKKLIFTSILLILVACVYAGGSKDSLSNANYAGGNGTVISESETNEQKITVRKHLQKITLGDMADDERRTIYSDISKSEILCRLQKNDEISVSELWTVNTKKDNLHYVWLKVKSGNVSGFLYYDGAFYSNKQNKYVDINSWPYKDNEWEILDVIKSDGKTWTVRKLCQDMCVGSDSDKVELRDKPGKKDSKVVAKIPVSYKNGHGQINVKMLAVTEETDVENDSECWVQVGFEGKVGWVYGGQLSAERGGPKYEAPEETISFSLDGK